MTNRLGVRARFTLLYGMALVITVLLVSGGIYFFVQRALMGQIENHLRKDCSTIQDYLKHDPDGLVKMADHGPILLFRVREGDKPVVSSDDWITENLEQAVPTVGDKNSVFSATAANGRRYRILYDISTPGTDRYQITVAHSEESVRQTRKTLALIILFILPLALLSSLAVGYIIAGRVLAPIKNIISKAEEIGADNLSERLPVGNTEDDFFRLAVVFNQTFGRIEDSFARLRSFTADASHELRTPLAAIRSIGETALHAPEGTADCREAIGSILEETDRLKQMVDSLLLLSRADSKEIVLQREPVNLYEVVQETAELLCVLAEEKQQTISTFCSAKCVANVDRSSVRQALTNLLDNAIKYAPAGGNISIVVGTTANNELFVEISDKGIGIPESDLKRIFDRFYRVDKGRSREMGGAGLGLAITKWAVESNGGRIEVESVVNEGSVFRVLFSG